MLKFIRHVLLLHLCARQVADSPHTRHKKVSTSYNGYKARQARYPPAYRCCLHGNRPSVRGMRADEWVVIVIESIEVRIIDPRVLNEFKLTRDIGVKAEKVQSALLIIGDRLIAVRYLRLVDGRA